MPEHGRVVRIKSRKSPAIDFYPYLTGRDRYLWSFFGRAFSDEAEAATVLERIQGLSKAMPLAEAVSSFRSPRSKRETVWTVCERFLSQAEFAGSQRTGEPYAARTLAHYRAVLTRARPRLEAATMSQFFAPRALDEFRAWFRAPEPDGRALESDNEAANCFAALRAVVRDYQRDNPDFAVNWPPMPTKATIAKKARKARLRAHERGRLKLKLPEVVQGIEAIPEAKRPMFWVWFYTQARMSEVRAVLGRDYHEGRIWIERGAEGKSAHAQIRHSTKTGHDGAYLMPESVRELIDRHCTHARFDPDLPLFRNPDVRASGPMWSEDAIHATWRAALASLQLPWGRPTSHSNTPR